MGKVCVAGFAVSTDGYGAGSEQSLQSVAHGWVELDLPAGGCLALTTHSGSHPNAGAGGSIAFEVADVHALTATLKPQGVVFQSTNIRGPACRMAVCMDSEGNKIRLHQLDRKPNASARELASCSHSPDEVAQP